MHKIKVAEYKKKFNIQVDSKPIFKGSKLFLTIAGDLKRGENSLSYYFDHINSLRS